MIQQDTKTVIKGFLDGGEQITLFLQQCIKSPPMRQKIHSERGLWLAIVD